ncbi:transposase [Maribacter sp. ACAM166]|uniref:transposase n=1 Tax=Maribacter sp. ACAM166 TaxID=2508996 RepID=UPI0010FE84F2|nr:transposase [Maribacter sp. ACAM166]TLP81875.1 transposase [Maribacter sp. ACAM166]
MKSSKFSESQIIKALKENEQGRSVGDVSRELGIDKSTFYYWRKKYGGMELLKYYELDTLAMAMIYEHFRYDLI